MLLNMISKLSVTFKYLHTLVWVFIEYQIDTHLNIFTQLISSIFISKTSLSEDNLYKNVSNKSKKEYTTSME